MRVKIKEMCPIGTHYLAINKQPLQLLNICKTVIEVMVYNRDKTNSCEHLVVYTFFSIKKTKIIVKIKMFYVA